MTLLPIVERELRVRARWPLTYNARWVAVGIALLIGFPMLLETNPGRGVSHGQRMFAWLSGLAFLYCLFEGARQTADCLSSERRSGTLGLLFLTDLKGYDVVLGKIAGTALSSFYGLLAVLPVIASSIFAGGVTGGEFWRMVLVLLVTLFFSLSVGMYVSSRSREEQKAMGGAAALLLGITGGLPCLDLLIKGSNFGAHGLFSLASPGYPFFLAFDMNYRTGGPAFGKALLVILLLSLLCLGFASRAARETMEEHNGKGFWHPLGRVFVSHGTAAERATLIGEAGRKAARRRHGLAVSPMLWLAERHRGQVVVLWAITGTMALAVFLSSIWNTPAWNRIAALALGLVQIPFWFCAAAIASRFFADLRRNGALELLLCTPLKDADLLEAQWLHLRRALAGPIICVWLMSFWLLLEGAAGKNTASIMPGVVPLILQGFGLMVQYLAVCWVGIWMGITCRRPAHAVIKTFGLVVFVPWLLCAGGWRLIPMTAMVPMMGLSIGSMFIQWVLKDWAKQNLEADGIRALIMKQISGVPRLHRQQPALREESLSWH